MQKVITKKTTNFSTSGGNRCEMERRLLEQWVGEINADDFRVITFYYEETGRTSRWAHFICEPIER